MDAAAYRRLAAEYKSRWGLSLYLCDAEGGLVLGRAACENRAKGESSCRAARKLAMDEALRWGEPTIQSCRHGRMLWAVPIMRNAELLGALVAGAAESRVFDDDRNHRLDARAACRDLLEMAVRENLTNEALLELHRAESDRQRLRAEAIHDYKASGPFNFQRMYLRQEPRLTAAIRRDDRPAARRLLNTMLTAMIHHAGDRFEMLKGSFLELVITMTRTAIETGGRAELLLGRNYRAIAELAEIRDDVELARWLSNALESIMDAFRGETSVRRAAAVTGAMEYMAAHLDRPITRDDAAKAACVSPSHLSRLLRSHLGCGFTEAFNRMRIERAAELLARGAGDVTHVAMELGFDDPSYFTKVFRRHAGCTPRQHIKRTRKVPRT